MDYNVDNIESKAEVKPTMDTDIVLHKDGKFQRAKIFGFDGKIKKAYVEAVINETNNNYTVDPEQIVPSEALYNDTPETLAGDVLKRVDKFTGEDVNYREANVWRDGTVMTDAKVDGVAYLKRGDKYYKRVVENFASPLWFGAKGDGVTDDTVAIQKTLDFYNHIYLPKGVFISKAITLEKDKHLFGSGRDSILRFKDGEEGVFITIPEGANVSDLCVSGGNYTTQVASAIEGTRIGIQSAVENGSFSNITVHSFDKYGIFLNTSNYARIDHLNTHSIKIKNCYVGLKIQAEYLLHSNIDITGCRYGVYLGTGNNSFSNCKIHENYYGFYLVYTVGNEGHGNMNNSMINHNTIAISCTSIGLGFNFIGNQIFEGRIEFTDCKGIHISNCELDATEYSFIGSGRNTISHNTMIMGYANTITHNSDNTVFFHNSLLTGEPFIGDSTNVGWKKVWLNQLLYSQYNTMYLNKSDDGNFYLLSDQTNTGEKALFIQAGAGSGSFGAGVVMYGASHPTKGGDYVAGALGKFRVNSNGIDGGMDVFSVDVNTKVISFPNGIPEFTDKTSALLGGLVQGDLYRTEDVVKIIT